MNVLGCSPTGSCLLGENSSLRVHRWRNLDPDDVLADNRFEDKDKVDASKSVLCRFFLYEATCFLETEILNKLRCQLLLKGTICSIFT